MISLHLVREILGWCAVINISVLMISTLMAVLASGPMKEIHRSLFGLSDEELSRAYFQYLSHYKIAILIFSIVPYFALCIVE